MYRKIMGFLEAWKENEHRKPLILQGARQVGKTYSILEFGRIHYENVAYFNFETNPKLNETFEEKISPDYLIPILSHIAGQTIVKEKTLIVFDEVSVKIFRHFLFPPNMFKNLRNPFFSSARRKAAFSADMRDE